MADILRPNTDTFLDPDYAAGEAQRAFGEYFAVAVELRGYGRDLFKRLMAVAVRDLPDLVLVAGLLRQVVVAIDAWHLCASSGAGQAAKVHLRSLLEASLYIDWILRSDKETRARRLYIANVRANRRAARRLIKGTEEQRVFSESWKSTFGHPYETTDDVAAAAREQDQSALDSMEAAPNEPVYRDFEAFVASYRREPEWYQIGQDGVQSIFGLATALGRQAEYYALYETYSDATHGSRTDLHFRKNREGAILIEPVRNPAHLKEDICLAIGMPIRIFLKLIEHYRPQEREMFVRNYITRWRSYTRPPNVQVNEKVVEFLE